jgi:hypothetical protein
MVFPLPPDLLAVPSEVNFRRGTLGFAVAVPSVLSAILSAGSVAGRVTAAASNFATGASRGSSFASLPGAESAGKIAPGAIDGKAEIDVASASLKLAVPDGTGAAISRAAVRIEMVGTCMNAPQVLLHSVRQRR